MGRTTGALLVTGAVALVGALGAAVFFGQPVFGSEARGDRRARMEASPHFQDGHAVNLIPTELSGLRDMAPLLRLYMENDAEVEPPEGLPPIHPIPDAKALLPQGEGGLRVTWMGHSTLLIEIDGHLVLTDPVFSERASPVQWAGPARFHPPPIALADLPDVDVVVISHDHYDHLDYDSILALADRGATFAVALGVGAHLEGWGVPPERIHEVDWWDEIPLPGLTLVSTPARHFSGRGLTDRDKTLWTSWAILGPTHRVWFSGDTGPFEQAAEIGERLGPFDLTFIEVGAYHPAWGNIHLGPDGAALMHQRVGGRVLFPVHWGTFNLALHAWDQPIHRLTEVATEAGIPLLAPLAGETVSPEQPEVAPFWRERIAEAGGPAPGPDGVER